MMLSDTFLDWAECAVEIDIGFIQLNDCQCMQGKTIDSSLKYHRKLWLIYKFTFTVSSGHRPTPAEW